MHESEFNLAWHLLDSKAFASLERVRAPGERFQWQLRLRLSGHVRALFRVLQRARERPGRARKARTLVIGRAPGEGKRQSSTATRRRS